MRLGGAVFHFSLDPESWVAEHIRLGYRAGTFPVNPDAGSDTIQAYVRAAQKAGIMIAEVGVWNNPLNRDETERLKALSLCQRKLALADEVGARCCVNVAGSLGPSWYGPFAEDLNPAAFDLVVESVRQIIDAVKPRRSFYTLECMPWMIPDSAESCLQLLRAVDRRQFAVHFDPVNLLNSPAKYFQNGALMKDFMEKLGVHIRSVHIKDVRLEDTLTVHLREVRPGLGGLNYPALLNALEQLDPEMPILLEHLPDAQEYAAAAAFVRSVAAREGVAL